MRSPVPSPTQAPQLHVPSLAQIQALGATPWQQAQAQVQAKQIPMLTQDWRDLWRNGFKVKSKDFITAPITFKGIPLQPHPSQAVFLAGGRGGKSLFINNVATLQKAMIDDFNLGVNLKAKL